MAIHWCGTGRSAGPGLRRLIDAGHDPVVWNRTPDKAFAIVGDLTDRIHAFEFDTISRSISEGDVLVSMLPDEWQVPLADMCINKGAHFVSPSYISAEMRELHAKALVRGVSVVNETGLDPGLDHIMAHDLVAEYIASGVFHQDNDLSFNSYCGGVPKFTNAFRYKFSWSPLSVLHALQAPARFIRNFTDLTIARPWDAITSYEVPLPRPETFEVYPNRDSTQYLDAYHFEPTWRIKEFARGTLRLNGWADAWSAVFDDLETLRESQDETRLNDLSDQLWRDNAYAKDEPDRVVLCTDLKAEMDGETVWHKGFVLEAIGDVRGSAMARLVSTPVSLAAEAVLQREMPAGVTIAPHDPKLVSRFLDETDKLAHHLQLIDHLA